MILLDTIKVLIFGMGTTFLMLLMFFALIKLIVVAFPEK